MFSPSLSFFLLASGGSLTQSTNQSFSSHTCVLCISLLFAPPKLAFTDTVYALVQPFTWQPGKVPWSQMALSSWRAPLVASRDTGKGYSMWEFSRSPKIARGGQPISENAIPKSPFAYKQYLHSSHIYPIAIKKPRVP